MKRAVVLLLAVVAGCGSPPKGPPEDATLSRFAHAGDNAYALEHPEEAIGHYNLALARARARDDAAAIADAGFNLAASQLRAGKPQEAIDTVAELRGELAWYGRSDPALDLVTATALFRLNDLANADAIASVLTAGKAADVADAAWFLRGMIADARGDRAGLERAAASLSPRADSADIAELRARLTADAALALKSADARRDVLDYRGMARTIALAAQFTADAGRASELYLRAGMSAAAQGDKDRARAWLTLARDRAPDSVRRAAAEKALR